MTGGCHCGAVQITVPGPPAQILQCNCALCRKTGWIGGYWHPEQVELSAAADVLTAYVSGDRTVTVWHCKICGSTSHWTPRTAPPGRMGVNMRIFDRIDWRHVPVQHVDGASL